MDLLIILKVELFYRKRNYSNFMQDQKKMYVSIIIN